METVIYNMTPGDWLFVFILIATMILTVKLNKLTLSGALTAGMIGCGIFSGAGFTGIFMIGLFFLLGNFATSWQTGIKEKLGAAEKDKGKRTAAQVIANGGMAAIAGLFCWFFPDQQSVFRLIMAAALASATADTLSSELGTVYGKSFYNIVNLKKGRRGENGVVSLEGSLFGIAGSIAIALVYAIGFGWNNDFFSIVIAGTAGNFADSVLGATLERKHFLNNNTVNFLNTSFAALIAFVLSYIS